MVSRVAHPATGYFCNFTVELAGQKAKFIWKEHFHNIIMVTGLAFSRLKGMTKSKQSYLAFSKWRVQLYRSQKPRHSVRFFRRSRNHSLLWNFVMHGYYSGSPPSVGECEEVTAWSRPTTRKLLKDAEARGFVKIQAATDDQRKRIVFPTGLTVAEYEAMVDGYMRLWKTLKAK